MKKLAFLLFFSTIALSSFAQNAAPAAQPKKEEKDDSDGSDDEQPLGAKLAAVKQGECKPQVPRFLGLNSAV